MRWLDAEPRSEPGHAHRCSWRLVAPAACARTPLAYQRDRRKCRSMFLRQSMLSGARSLPSEVQRATQLQTPQTQWCTPIPAPQQLGVATSVHPPWLPSCWSLEDVHGCTCWPINTLPRFNQLLTCQPGAHRHRLSGRRALPLISGINIFLINIMQSASRLSSTSSIFIACLQSKSAK